MSCQACATTIQEAISALPGAKDVQTNFALKQLNYEGLERAVVVQKLRELGYDSPEPKSSSAFHVEEVEELGKEENIYARNRFLLAFVLGFPEFLMGMGLWPHNFYHWPAFVDALFASVVVLVAGFDIHRRTFKQLRNGNVNMDTLVTLGSGAALLQSFVLLLRGSSMPGFEAASTIVVFILFGRYLEAATRRQTYSATAELFSAFQHPVTRVLDKKEEQVLGLELKVGDHIRLKPGEVCPADGIIVEGKTQISDLALTGEVKPKSVGPGTKILSGTTIIDSPVLIIVKKVGEESFLGRLILELEKAQNQTIPIQRFADRITTFFVPAVILFACLASVAQFLLKDATPEFSLNVFLSVVLTACPCALGLAIPTALVAGLGASARRGLLFRDAAALEACGRIKELYLDKTGTLTLGQPRLEKIIATDKINERDLLIYAAALNRQTIHPLGKALADAAIAEKLFALPQVQDLKVRGGEGVEGDIKGLHIALLRNTVSTRETEEGTISDLFIDSKLAGRFIFKDKLIPEAPEILKTLKEWGITLHVLTGDSASSVRQLGLEKIVESVRSGLLPQDKEFIVRAAREKNPNGVAFVGDGINDVLALSVATVGIAVASGSPAALGAGSVSISNGIKDLPNVFYFAARVSRQLKFNLFWALGYNVVMLPFAASGDISPMWSSLAMAMSSVSVVLGSVWLGFRLQRQKH
jgi:P-type Cu+ transporter